MGESCSSSEPASRRRAKGACLSVSEALERGIESCLDALAVAAQGVRDKKPEAIHQVRVCGRRLQSMLSMYGGFAAGETGRLQRACEWLIDEFGPAQEIDVFLVDVVEPAAAYSDLAGVVNRLRRVALIDRRKAYRRAVAALSSSRYRMLVSGTRRLGRAAGRTKSGQGDAAVVAAKAVSAAMRKLQAGKRLSKLGKSRLHRLRLRAKHMRYSVEIARDVLRGQDADLKQLLKALAKLQSALGSIHDMSVHRKTLRALLSEPKSKRSASSIGEQIDLLLPRRKKRERKLLGKALDAYQAVRETRTCWS